MLAAAYDRIVDSFLRTRVGGWTNLHVMTPVDARLMRWTGGRLSTAFGSKFGPHAVLLRSTGAKTGHLREVPLVATPDGDDWILIASATGQARNPAWYHNLKANPHCSLLVPHRGRIDCVARETTGPERHRAWDAANRHYGGYATYQARTDRAIPVMILSPRNAPATPS
ncbi:nitroreductase family deazaflavin-dependent oxidoreductase [Mycobacterium yunnanensis]|uniref:Nitroreductase family deazaflavin-dependent oxidoreductase n=1 Tax=Mycobacterium yunnanensis TaxID=368477 RepID=A0A9X2YWU3_9MYCO|nr:nitroreductase family deazaflavin-dependent oxidoreductase [Mycobacterium yunnanensis]MCV7419988.1 nitroreductase family deazaflavin-dependent oxidoreductase [Mycobacterium yunnanensis]